MCLVVCPEVSVLSVHAVLSWGQQTEATVALQWPFPDSHQQPEARDQTPRPSEN